MHSNAEIDPNHSPATTKLFAQVWIWLLLLTVLEIFLAYERVEVHIMITLLIGISLVKSALIVAYFMHLRFEKLGLFLTIVPATVFCICMMMIVFFPDSLHLAHVPHY
ncbi:MAG: cytochrome C oxidase subunit IV family protein [Candidatus Sulfotelmatobacter sp.]|jgi:cytochrome c oxidase subunit IV